MYLNVITKFYGEIGDFLLHCGIGCAEDDTAAAGDDDELVEPSTTTTDAAADEPSHLSET